MNYREIRKAKAKVSQFGFGCMRLPLRQLPDGTTKAECIDEPEAIAMIRKAIDEGVNYVDTAYLYHGGMSEVVLGKALKDGYREKVYVADKIPVWVINPSEGKAGLWRILNEELERLQVECIDFCLIHALDAQRWQILQGMDFRAFFDEARAAGKIKFPCFSFHGTPDVFREIIDSYDQWVMAQIMLNYIDYNFQAGLEGMKYAYDRGVDIVIMEPLKGGQLVDMVAPEAEALFRAARPSYSNMEWAMRWLYSFREIAVVLSGVSTMKQLEEHLVLASQEKTGLDEEEMQVLEKARELFLQNYAVPCSSCRYCQPCPSGVNIPDVFTLYNALKVFKNKGFAKLQYGKLAAGFADASRCIACGQCESHCPRKIEIIQNLRLISEEMSAL